MKWNDGSPNITPNDGPIDPSFAVPFRDHFWKDWTLVTVLPLPKRPGYAYVFFLSPEKSKMVRVYGFADGTPAILVRKSGDDFEFGVMLTEILVDNTEIIT